jgi:hypothetical protein
VRGVAADRSSRPRRALKPLRCSVGAEEGCRGTLRLYVERLGRKRGLRRIGERKRFFLEAGEYRRVKVRIGRRGGRRLAREHRPSIRARVRYESIAGGTIEKERRYRLRG